jgi:hypothetical protein
VTVRIAIAALGGLLLLNGCVPSPEEQAAAAAQQRAADQSQCSGFGFKPDTDAFAQCMMTLSTKRDEQAAANARAAKARKDAEYQACVARVAAANPPNPHDDELRAKILLDAAATRAGC